MTIILKQLESKDFENLYSLLKDVQFPHLPSKQEAKQELNQNDNHIYLGVDSQKEDDIVLFLCFCERNSKLYFDIACKQEYRKKWASKEIIHFIFNKAFNDLNYDKFIVESLNQNARDVVERFGFRNIKGNFYYLKKSDEVVSKYLRRDNK